MSWFYSLINPINKVLPRHCQSKSIPQKRSSTSPYPQAHSQIQYKNPTSIIVLSNHRIQPTNQDRASLPIVSPVHRRDSLLRFRLADRAAICLLSAISAHESVGRSGSGHKSRAPKNSSEPEDLTTSNKRCWEDRRREFGGVVIGGRGDGWVGEICWKGTEGREGKVRGSGGWKGERGLAIV